MSSPTLARFAVLAHAPGGPTRTIVIPLIATVSSATFGAGMGSDGRVVRPERCTLTS